MAVNEKTIETLVESVRRISISLDLDEVLDTIFESLKEMIDYSAAVICVIDARSGAVYELKTAGYPTRTWSRPNLSRIVASKTFKVLSNVNRSELM